MKSSPIRRSALSKESMDVIENISNEEKAETQNNNQTDNYTPDEYHRENGSESDAENKSKEIDLLWQTFRAPQFSTNSTFAHVFCGFLLGVVVSVAALALFIAFALNSDNPSKYDLTNIFKNSSQEKVSDVQTATDLAEGNIATEEIETPTVENESAQKEEVKAAKKDKAKKAKKADKKSESAASEKVKVKKYIIKDGDTVEGIIKHNYGAYTQERAEAIMKVNHLKDLDHIGIDQELLLPVEK